MEILQKALAFTAICYQNQTAAEIKFYAEL